MKIEELLALNKQKGSKFKNSKTEYNGIVFDSKKEAEYAQHLDMLLRGNAISGYERQPAFPVVINGKKCFTYKADFRVKWKDGKEEIVDVKGFRTDIYRLKKKCVEAMYGIEIVEV